jgi:hypothetical protein
MIIGQTLEHGPRGLPDSPSRGGLLVLLYQPGEVVGCGYWPVSRGLLQVDSRHVPTATAKTQVPPITLLSLLLPATTAVAFDVHEQPCGGTADRPVGPVEGVLRT